MAHSPQYQLSRQQLIKSLRWLSACAVDEQDMVAITYCEQLLVARAAPTPQSFILAALKTGAQTRADLMELTGLSEATVRRHLVRLLQKHRITMRTGEGRQKLYFVR